MDMGLFVYTNTMNPKKKRILRKAWTLGGFTPEDEIEDKYDLVSIARIDMLLAYNSLTKNKFIWALKEIEIARLIHDFAGMFQEVRMMQMRDSSILRTKKYIVSLRERIPPSDLIYIDSPVQNKINVYTTK